MKTNIEFKARCEDISLARELCRARNADLLGQNDQSDSYFALSSGRLKLRENSRGDRSLIYYDRLDSPLPRESEFEIVSVDDSSLPVVELFKKVIGVRVVITKKRETYRLGSAIVNLDDVDGLGRFIEIEVEADGLGDRARATRVADDLLTYFHLTPADLIPWSYADLATMYKSAHEWRNKLGPTPPIFLLDGASCTGKTTLATLLARRSSLDVQLVPRYSTRKPRGDRAAEPEYVFVSAEQFKALAAEGQFIEYRDFKFGMSYGLPWRETVETVARGARALGIIDLGNVRHVKSVLPEATTILVTAPEPTLRKRLRNRGYNEEHEMEERLENARKVRYYTQFYDHVIENGEGMLENAEESIATIMRDHPSRKNVTP
jgi:guanylate kinase